MQKRRKLIVAIATVCLAVFAVLGMAMAVSWITNGKVDDSLTIGKPISIGLTEGEWKYYDENGIEVASKTLLPGYSAEITVNYDIEVHDAETYKIVLKDNSSTADWQYWSLYVDSASDATALEETGCDIKTGLTADGTVTLKFYFDKGKNPIDATAPTGQANLLFNFTLELVEA